MLNVAGITAIFAPFKIINRSSSAKGRSKQMKKPNLTKGISNVVALFPADNVSDSLNFRAPSTSMPKRWAFI
jgi:hypothetical protein